MLDSEESVHSWQAEQGSPCWKRIEARHPHSTFQTQALALELLPYVPF